MKKRIVAIVTAVLTLVLGLAVLSACGNKSKGLSISQTEASIGVGDSLTLLVTAEEKTDLTWTTSDESVVRILTSNSTRCNLRGQKAGTATITAKGKNGGTVSCVVTVEDIVVKISEKSVKVERYETVQLTATVEKNGVAVNESVNWSSSDESVATVSNTGLVTGIKTGNTTITATRANGNASANCDVEVKWTNIPGDYYEAAGTGASAATGNPGHWSYWTDNDYFGAVVNMRSAEFMNGALHLDWTGNNSWAWYGVQVFYKATAEDNVQAGKIYNLTFKIKSNVAGWMTINGTDWHVEEGVNNISVYYIEEAGDASISIQMAVHDKITNNINPKSPLDEHRIESAQMEFSDLKWTEYTPVALDAPTGFSIENVELQDEFGEKYDSWQLKVTASYTGDQLEAAEGYEVGFFQNASDAKPVYSQKVMNSDKMIIDLNHVTSGDYTVKVRTYSVDARYTNSGWSAAQTYTAATDGVYTVAETVRNEDRPAGRWVYWTEWGQFSSAEYNKNTATLSFEMSGGASWYSNQIYYNTDGYYEGMALENDFYKISFTFVSSVASKIVVNGKIVEIAAGETPISMEFLYDGGSIISLILGEPTLPNWDGTAGSLGQGKFELKNIKVENAFDPDAPMNFGDDKAALENPDMLMYWYAYDGKLSATPETGYRWRASAKMNSYGYEANEESDTGYSYSFDYVLTTYSELICNWVVRFFYKNTSLTVGHEYFLTLTLTARTGGDIRINDQTVTLLPGTHEYVIHYTETSAPSLRMSMATDEAMIMEETLTIESIHWAEGSKSSLQAPGSLAVAADGTVTFSDPNNGEGVDHFELGFFDESNMLVASVTVANGDKLDTTALYNGTYTLKLRAVGDAFHYDTDWLGSIEYTVSDGKDVTVELGGQDDAVANPGVWYLWADDNWTGSKVVVSKQDYDAENKTLVIAYTTSGNPSLGYSVQLFYENASLNQNNQLYKLTFTVKLSVDGTITLNGKHIALKAGEEVTLTVVYLEHGFWAQYEEGASINIQMGQSGGPAVMNGEFVLSNWSWETTTAATLSAPTGLAIDASGVVTFTDPNLVGVEKYELGFFEGDSMKQSVTIKNGQKLNVSALYSGEYTLKVRAIGDNVGYHTSGWSNGVSYTVTNTGGVSYDVEFEKEANIPSDGRFYYWTEYDGIANARFADGALSFDVVNDGNWYSNQIFCHNSEGVIPKGTYTFTVTLVASEAGQLRLNEKNFDIVAGTQTLTIESSNANFALFMAVPGTNADGSTNWDWGAGFAYKSGSFTFSNFTWTAADGTAYGLNGRIG